MQDVSPPRQPRIKKYVLEALPQGGPAPAYILLDAKCNQFIINLGPPGGGGHPGGLSGVRHGTVKKLRSRRSTLKLVNLPLENVIILFMLYLVLFVFYLFS